MSNQESKYIKITHQLITVASDAVSFWGLFDALLDQTFSTEFGKAFEFNQIIRIASLSALLTELNKLVDKSGYSLYKIRDYLKQNPRLFGKSIDQTNELIAGINSRLTKNESIIKNLREQRNKIHIHLDKKNIEETLNIVYSESPVNLNTLEPLLRSLCECLGLLVALYRNIEPNPFRDVFEEGIIRNFIIDKDSVAKNMNIKEIIVALKNMK